MPVAIHLFHGRNHPDDELEDWGFDGPTFGPFDYAHTTYGAEVKFDISPQQQGCTLHTNQNMVFYDGKWYGDWSVYGYELATKKGVPLTKFDPDLARIDAWDCRKVALNPGALCWLVNQSNRTIVCVDRIVHAMTHHRLTTSVEVTVLDRGWARHFCRGDKMTFDVIPATGMAPYLKRLTSIEMAEKGHI